MAWAPSARQDLNLHKYLLRDTPRLGKPPLVLVELRARDRPGPVVVGDYPLPLQAEHLPDMLHPLQTTWLPRPPLVVPLPLQTVQLPVPLHFAHRAIANTSFTYDLSELMRVHQDSPNSWSLRYHI